MGKLDMKKMNQKAEDLKKSGGSGADFDKLESGKNVRRVLPPKGDNDVFWSEGYLHFNVGPEGNQTVTCLETYGQGKKCPVCQYVEQLKKSKKAEDKKLAETIRRVKRTYLAVFNRDADEEKPLVLPVGKTILQPIIDLICDPDYGDITDFEDGRDITITKTGKGLQTEYSVIAKPKTSVASEDVTAEELDELLPDLDSIFIKRTAEELQAIMDGESLNGEDDGEDDNGYDDLELDELEVLCKKRHIKLPPKVTKLKLITLLEKYDAAEAEDGDGDDDGDDEPPARKDKTGNKQSRQTEDDDGDGDGDGEDGDGDDDELQGDIEAAIKNRKKQGGRK